MLIRAPMIGINGHGLYCARLILIQKLAAITPAMKITDACTADQIIIFGENTVPIRIDVKPQSVAFGLANKSGETIIQIPSVMVPSGRLLSCPGFD